MSCSFRQYDRSSLTAAYRDAGIETGELDAFSSPLWFQVLAETCLTAKERTLVLSAGGVVWPFCVEDGRFGSFRWRSARALANVYSCRFSPPGLQALARYGSERAVMDAVRTLAAELLDRGLARLRFDALPGDLLPLLRKGFAAVGWWTEPFPQFGNWYLRCDDVGFAPYWQERPSRLRNTEQRGRRALFQTHGAAARCFRRPEEAGAAVSAYTAIRNSAWQPAEPFPQAMPELIRRGLAAGDVRLWTLIAEGKPIAGQIWLCRSGAATIFKLAFNQGWRRCSPGTVLTRIALEHAIADPEIRQIDFGRGDDAYKRDWLPERRQRYGLMAYNPRTVPGLAVAGRNLLPHLFRPRAVP